ncbi:MAG: ABC transporter permease [Planctomycetota bacterium]
MTGAVSKWLRTAGPLLGLVVTWVLFAALAGGTFTSWSNQQLMLLQTAVVGTAAVGATWIIVSGGIDLSVGANVALSSMVGAFVLRDGHGLALAATATVVSGGVIGWLIGALVTGALVRAVLVAALAGALGYAAAGLGGLWAGAIALAVGVAAWIGSARVPALARLSLPLSPFIVTLGLWGALRGLGKGLGDNQPIYFEGNDTLEALMLSDGLLPPGVWVLLVVAVAASLLLQRSVFGRHVVAMGSSRETARLCGIDLPKTELRVYVLGCGCAGLAALMQLSYLSMGDPTTGQGLELKAIAAAVIGGASLAGGEGSILGTMLGALIMTVVDSGCTKLGLDNWVQEVVTGAIIVAAVALDRWRQGRH